MPIIKFVDSNNPINRVGDHLQVAICNAQEQAFDLAYANASDFVSDVVSQLRLGVSVPAHLSSVSAPEFADVSFGEFNSFFADVLYAQSYPTQAVLSTASGLATRTMLLRAFASPDDVVAFVRDRVISVVNDFPESASDIEVGRNKGDVLDPFILAANQFLLYEGDFDSAVAATVSHKALMIIEGLMGHLHEDVLGLMRGNVRIPEPRGKDQEAFSYDVNPFPGADLLQPPAKSGEPIRLHQIKSKTGSAKGGDGKRLGDQLQYLADHYSAEVFYDALVGNTLVGHRSKTGVERAAPGVRVLVGQAAFHQLTGSAHGASLLLRLYQEAFVAAAHETGYSISSVTERIVAHFKEKADEAGESFLETILQTSTSGPPESLDSALFNRVPTKSRGRKKAPARRAR